MKARALGNAALLLLVGGTACEIAENARAEPRDDARAELERQLGGAVPLVLDTASAVRLSGAFRGAAATALDAVVQIAVTSRGVLRAPPGPFHDFAIPNDGQERLMQGNGSGFIFDERGHILTNHHVIENAVDIRVTLVDGREFGAELVGSDPNSDVAVIRIQGDDLPVAAIGDSDNLKVGDWVLALGSPLGLRFTVTAGIVSATGRNIGILGRAGTELEAFIQTDAAINPGNSGGPLVDLKGRVVGINSAIQTQTGYFAGAGFAIPINLARKFADDLVEYGVVHRPRLGVVIDEVNDADAEVYKLPRVGGVEVRAVTPGDAADRAGVRMGDVILNINGEPVAGVSELQARIARFQPGEEVELGIARYGTVLSAKVKLGEFEAAPRRTSDVRLERGSLGFTVAPMPVEYAGALGRPGRRDVPIVQEVDQLGPAFEARLRPSHVILQVNGREVRTVADVRRATARLGSGDVVSLVVLDPRQEEALPTIINYRIR
ncbi:MAG TPA: trypsin-like peptidase domain-containing protein [Longimicrobiales bacterium]|nr:trypsin-like peptidase domain-containing protein [Longimicrobiales bacterium]